MSVPLKFLIYIPFFFSNTVVSKYKTDTKIISTPFWSKISHGTDHWVIPEKEKGVGAWKIRLLVLQIECEMSPPPPDLSV